MICPFKKELPEGRYIEVDYYTDKTHRNKVKAVTTPAGVNGSTSTQFIYGSGYTEVYGPQNCKTIHRFNEDLQLVSVEHYLNGSLYRVQKKVWGKKKDATYLIGETIEDEKGNAYYAKTLSYDSKGNILEQREYGNLTGANPHPLTIEENGLPETSQEFHAKAYSYYTTEDADIILQKDVKGTGVELGYKKGTNLLIRKSILEKAKQKKYWLYEYNEDAALTKVIVDDGEARGYWNEIQKKYIPIPGNGLITSISPKEHLPHVGAPEVIEEGYYLDVKGKKTALLSRTVNHFDTQGNIEAQDIYDANGEQRYTLKKTYEGGLLKKESDPVGSETIYFYDQNHNLLSKAHLTTGASFEYGYDLKNRLIYTAEKDGKGHVFETHTAYDPFGCKVSEVDRFGNQTLYHHDDLGRLLSISYPEVREGENSSIKPTYTYQYDLFDHAISLTNPKGETTVKAYTLRGQPTQIQYPDGTQERFKYDAEGSLHRHLSKDGTVRVFEYDYMGRLDHIEHYARSSKESGEWLSSIKYTYNAFRMLSEKDEEGALTTYTYEGGGRLASLSKDSRKVEFFYDPLGRIKAIKKWKTANTFTLETKEYDLLDKIVEERVEDSQGNILLKYKYVYDQTGLLQEVIGYPQNQESTIKKYGYDGFGRLIAIRDAFDQVTEIIYEDTYIDDWGQRVLKRTEIDPLGSRKEEILDTAGRVVKMTKKNKKGQVLAESELFYDTLGNELLEKNNVLFSGELLRTYRTVQTYDPGSQLITITHTAGSAEEKTTALQYNAYGDIATKQSGKIPITYQYGSDGKLKSLSCSQGASDKESTYKLSYDKKGNITEVRWGIYTQKYKFDPHNAPLSETIQDEFGSYQVSCMLDGEGLIQSIQLPDGSFVEYNYAGPFVTNILRFAKDKKQLYSYRVASRDLMGNVLEEVLIGHAGARTQKWDQAGRKVEISTDFFQDKIPEGGYDPLHNVRKRELSLDDEKYTIDYSYDDFSNLIYEKDKIERHYSFDSLGNRLKKDDLSYTVNELNQILEANGNTYTFDANGNLASKTTDGKTWSFQYNALNQLVLIKDPDQTTLFFTYDLSGKRLSKKIETKGKKSKIFRYFYIGETEIGCLDEKGVITELSIPSNPNNPEATPFIAIEIQEEVYAPLYDLQGNIACLVDPERRNVVESYRYSAFGEEEIINERGRSVSDSSVGNPWRYRGKRVDKEIGLLYFGYRYYDPEVGRWISPDPAGKIDGPNLYAFCHNNPLTYVDYFGLASEVNNASVDEKYFYGEYEPHCFCERHRDCKRGGDIGNTLSFLNPNTSGIGASFQTRSTAYETGSIDLDNGEIGFINGINNAREEAQRHAFRLSQYAQGVKIQSVYNATHSVPMDILECGLGLCRISTPPVQLLKNRWNRFISTKGPTAKYLQICHSGGAIHVFNALASSPKAVRDRIIVLAISPGAIIPARLCYRAYNYASKRDFVPDLDVVGKLLYGNELIMLNPHPDAPWHDHGVDSPTFQKTIKEHIIEYLKQIGELK